MKLRNWYDLRKITRLLGKMGWKIGVKMAGFVRWYFKTMTSFITCRYPLTREQEGIRIWLLVASIWIFYLIVYFFKVVL